MTLSDPARIEVMKEGGISNPQDVLERARLVGLHLADACALLQNETFGGLNIFGADPGGTALPVKYRGQAVTWYRYNVYRRNLRAGLVANGVGPCQLTSPALQQQADNLGGCWKPPYNLQVGFAFLKGLQTSYGREDAFYHFNGSGPAARAYATLAMQRSITWEQRFAHA